MKRMHDNKEIVTKEEISNQVKTSQVIANSILPANNSSVIGSNGNDFVRINVKHIQSGNTSMPVQTLILKNRNVSLDENVQFDGQEAYIYFKDFYDQDMPTAGVRINDFDMMITISDDNTSESFDYNIAGNLSCQPIYTYDNQNQMWLVDIKTNTLTCTTDYGDILVSIDFDYETPNDEVPTVKEFHIYIDCTELENATLEDIYDVTGAVWFF